MNFNEISAWSIRNPVVPIVIFLGLVIAGIMSFATMEVQNDPDIEFPVVIVVISQPGAAPSEIENQITQRVEAAVQNVQGVERIEATASEGSSQIVVNFEIGTDLAQAVNEVKAQVDQIRGELPDGILEPRVFRASTTSQPIGYFAVAADDMTLEQLSYFIDDTLTKRLLSIEGLAEIGRGGGVSREILVIVDPAKMQSLGVTASQINNTLRSVNVDAAGGQAEIAGSRQSVRVLGTADTAYELSQAQIAVGGGRTVKLSEVATVRDSFGEVRSLGRIDGRDVVTFSVTRSRGASDVTVYDEVIEELEALQEENPGVTFTPLNTSVDYTKAQYSSSMAAMIEGAVLAVIVVFFFLRDWRATIIAALAIPLSAIPTFWFMDLLGFTLNSMSLLALGLVAGVLVDDAIVEIENIVRHMRMGKSAYQASIDAADEIGLAVVATTFSIVAVFLPVGLMPGVAGQFFKNFGLTVVVSVLMSLLVARMITPMVAAYFLKAKGHAEHGEGPLMDRYIRVLRWSLDRSGADRVRARNPRVRSRPAYYAVALLLMVAAFVGTYFMPVDPQAEPPGGFALFMKALLNAGLGFVVGWLLTLVVAGLFGLISGAREGFGGWVRSWWARIWARGRDHRVWMMGIGVLTLVLSGVLIAMIPKQFFPNVNSDTSTLRIQMVPGTTLEQTEAVTSRVSRLINEQPEVAVALERITEGDANLYITLNKERERTSQEFERQLTPLLQQIPDARISFQDQQGGGGGTGRPISVMLSGSDPDLLNRTASTLVEQMQGLDGIVAPRIEADLQRPELIVEPRDELAASLGVSTVALSQTIRIATLGDIDQNAARFSLSDRQVPIRVRLAADARRDIDVIRNLPVPTASGGSVPLERVADIRFGAGPTAIQRYNQSRRIFVGADLEEGVASGDAMTAILNLPIMQNLPQGVSNAPVGAQEWQADMIRDFTTALIAAVLLVFAVLVLLYHRFVSPLVNMGSLFLAPFGGLLALFIVGQPISMPVFIGILMLFGIVSKNSILLIDFAIEEMATGKDKFDAIVEAGHKRAQPIVMTTVAMTAGMIPTAISLTGDGAWRAPMGTVVIGGLIMSTLLTLLIVPAGFSLADGFEKRMGPWLSRKFLTYKPADSAADRAGLGQQPAE